MSKPEKEEIILELESILEDLRSYRRLTISSIIPLTSSIFFKGQINSLSSKLQHTLALYKPFIVAYGGDAPMKLPGIDMDVFELALAYDTDHSYTEHALHITIQKVNTAIGKLQASKEFGDGQIQAPEDSIPMEIQLFNKMQFHPKVIEVSRKLYVDGHYAQAITEAYKAIDNFVKQKTGESIYGKELMGKVFKKDDPIIKLNELKTQSNRNEQEGFMHLFQGAMIGIRNPKAHDNVFMADPYKTLEYLSFASLLMRRADEGKLVRTRKKQSKSKET